MINLALKAKNLCNDKLTWSRVKYWQHLYLYDFHCFIEISMNVTGTTVCAVEESASIPLEATGVNVQMAMSSPQIRRPVKVFDQFLSRSRADPEFF